MKKVLLISNMYPSEANQAYGIFVKNFEKSLQTSEITVVGKAVIKGRGKTLFGKIFKYLIFFIKVIYFGLSIKHDIIYVHYINHTAIPVYFLKLLKPKSKLVLNAHGGDIMHETSFSKLIFPFAKINVKKASLIVAPSSYFKEVLEKTYYDLKLDVFVSPSGGVNFDIFYPTNGPEILKENYNLSIGYIGRLEEGKGWEVFLKAIAILINQYGRTVTAHVVGSGSQKDEFLHKIEELKINNAIKYHGEKPQRELAKYFNKFDVFVFPSYRMGESLGLVGLEAMACGVPVIGSNIGGIATYVINGSQGFLFEKKNANDLANKVLKFENLSQEERRIFKINARSTANKYENKRVARELVERLALLT